VNPIFLLALLACASDDPVDSGACTPVAERCDGVDNDCNGRVDEGFDMDGDGAYVDEPGCRAMLFPIDCDDGDPSVRPAAVERCDDGVDNDCDGAVDDGADGDRDGFGACSDCDDDDAFVFPGAAEACDGVDNDCTGGADEPWDQDGDGAAACGGLPTDDCDDTNPSRAPLVPEACDGVDNNCDGLVDDGFDADGDGWKTCRGDCDDANAAVNPAAEEICDGLENDCDPTTLDDGDLDGDGFTRCSGDCNDSSAEARPFGVEACDGVDNDCDGSVDGLPECFGCAEVDRTVIPGVPPGTIACGTYTGWPTADAACTAFGLQLATTHDASSNGNYRDVGYVYFGGPFWLGLSDRAEEGVWAWVDGTPVDFTQWWPGEPNDSGSEDCAGSNFGDWGWWNDYNCSTGLPFVCEPVPSTSAGR
jgi:hypothetical protein